MAIIQVYFKQGTDPDMAAVNVQNRVAKAQGLLPVSYTHLDVYKRQTLNHAMAYVKFSISSQELSTYKLF